MANDSEEWRPVVGYEGVYEVSSIGRVKRVAAGQGARPGVRKQSTHPKGYKQVALSMNNIQATKKVHRLVAEAFIGPAPDGTEVCHTNDIPGDNRAENLRWDTHSQNHLDITRNGNRATHCKRGHEYTEENSFITTRGHKECQMCRKNHQQARTAATRERLHGKKF